MGRPLIAVVGDAAKCKDPALARRAADELGCELAKQGCRILVYSSSSLFVEWEVVQGYMRGLPTAPARSIEVRYPPELDGRFPGELADDPRFVRSQQGGDWEASIYPSFASLDGIVLIGGGYTTKISGLLAMGSRTPVISLGGLGGAAEQVWHQLRGSRDGVASDDDLNLMATRIWHEKSAERLVEALLSQRRRKQEQQQEDALGESERHRRSVLTRLAYIGTALFAFVLLALVESWASQLPRGALWLLFATPAVAGASGAAVRMLWDAWVQPQTPLSARPLAMTIALGFWAAGVAGTMFLLPQIWVLGTLDATHLNKLAGFAVPIGLIAGLTLDKVFPRLIKQEVPVDLPAGDGQVQPEPGVRRKRASTSRV